MKMNCFWKQDDFCSPFVSRCGLNTPLILLLHFKSLFLHSFAKRLSSAGSTSKEKKQKITVHALSHYAAGRVSNST
jgi:hypothetical protein